MLNSQIVTHGEMRQSVHEQFKPHRYYLILINAR